MVGTYTAFTCNGVVQPFMREHYILFSAVHSEMKISSC